MNALFLGVVENGMGELGIYRGRNRVIEHLGFGAFFSFPMRFEGIGLW